MIDNSFFFIFIIWYFYNYVPPHVPFNFLVSCHYLCDHFFLYFNQIINSEYWDDELIEKFEVDDSKISTKEPTKYEDKYLENIRTLDKEWIFTEDENTELPKLIEDFYNGYMETRLMRLEEISKQMLDLKKEIVEDSDDINYCDEEGDELICENTLEERNKMRNSQIQYLEEEASKIKLEIESEESICELKNNSEEHARQYIINKRLDKLANCYVMEKTPIGNVIMIYHKDKESFKYYSDCNIPYRYLEVVARKYVKLFNCRAIFVDMEEELRLFEEKWDKEKVLKKIKEEEDKKRAEEVSNNTRIEPKKNVFAKFKSYNKDAGAKISMAAPPKNSIPNKSISENKENEKILLKERANRYTYEGKFANFNFLQKVERKVFNKKLGLSFADFKKMKK
jgi:hypothetical protein